MEFKVLDDDREKTLDDTILSAKKQIKEKKYSSTLKEKGIKKITEMAIVFKGKQCKVDIIK